MGKRRKKSKETTTTNAAEREGRRRSERDAQERESARTLMVCVKRGACLLAFRLVESCELRAKGNHDENVDSLARRGHKSFHDIQFSV